MLKENNGGIYVIDINMNTPAWGRGYDDEVYINVHMDITIDIEKPLCLWILHASFLSMNNRLYDEEKIIYDTVEIC